MADLRVFQQEEDFPKAKEKALKIGAKSCHIEDIRKELYVLPQRDFPLWESRFASLKGFLRRHGFRLGYPSLRVMLTLILQQYRGTMLHGNSMQRCLRVCVSTWDQSGQTVSSLSYLVLSSKREHPGSMQINHIYCKD